VNAPREARHDVQAFMAGAPTSFTGSFEALFTVMFGPLAFDQHVKAYRNHLWITERQAANRRADANVRAYLAEQGVKLC
jgi:hypothetical protein